MVLDYKTVRDDSFLEEVHKHKIVDENILQRFGDTETRWLLLDKKHTKTMRIIQWLLFLHAITAFVVLPYLESTITNEQFVLLLQFCFSVTTLVLYPAFFWCWREGVNRKKTAVALLAKNKKWEFKTYFTEFVQHQILPSVNLLHLKKILASEVKYFSVETRADNKDISNRSMVVIGVYEDGAESVEVSIVLKFNKKYSCLELKNYHVNQHLIASRFNGSDNDC